MRWITGSFLAVGLLALPGTTGGQQNIPLSKNLLDVQEGTWKGVVLERSCFQKLGVAKATAPEHRACALECVEKGLPLAVLTDDDGLLTIVGEMANERFTKLTQYIGQRVEVTGTASRPTGNYIPRQIEISKITVVDE